MDLAYLIAHPQELNQETLYDLRRLVAIHPTYHAARILFLQNLFLLHDSTFDQELRRAALLVPDRRVLFDLTHTITNLASEKASPATPQPGVTLEQHATTEQAPVRTEQAPVHTEAEAVDLEAHPAATQPTPAATQPVPDTTPEAAAKTPKKKYAAPDTTARLLNDFLDTTPRPLAKKRIKADPATDYMAYLLQQEDGAPEPLVADTVESTSLQASQSSSSRLDDLIDSFIATSEEGIHLSEDPMIPEEFQEPDDHPTPESEAPAETEEVIEEIPEIVEEVPEAVEKVPEAVEEATEVVEKSFSSTELTEQLAQIYIKQGKYERAIEILSKINNADNSTSNPFLADQMRYLQKLAALKTRKTTNQK